MSYGRHGISTCQHSCMAAMDVNTSQKKKKIVDVVVVVVIVVVVVFVVVVSVLRL